MGSSCFVRRSPYRNLDRTVTTFLVNTLVVVHDLDVVGISVTPHETKTPLVVDPDTVLPFPIAAQRFQTVPRRCCQIAQLGRAVQLAELSAGGLLHGAKATTRLPAVKSLGFRTAERPDHPSILSCIAFNVKQ
jgi:hypothetical protein